jgi:hypothetical protein
MAVGSNSGSGLSVRAANVLHNLGMPHVRAHVRKAVQSRKSARVLGRSSPGCWAGARGATEALDP